MPPTCSICTDRKINFSNKCLTCKKCVCNYCYDRISLCNVYKDGEVINEYKCPFCKAEKVEELEDIDKGVLIEMTKTAVVNLREQYFEKQEIVAQYEELILDYKRKLKEVNKLKDIYDKYQKLGRKTIKLEEIKKMI